MNDAVWGERRLRIATDAAGVALWSWNVDTDRIAMDERAFDLWGIPPRDEITFEALSARILPADLDRVREAFIATRDLSGAYDLDFRVLHGDDVRWISARGRGDDEGIVGRIMFGVFLDVTDRKLAEEARELIAAEMQHRIKNLFSLASALANFSSRSTGSKEDMTRDFARRLEALSAAHDLIRPSINDASRAARLCDLLSVLLKPYSTDRARSPAVAIAAAEVPIGEQAASSLALIVHELATNSAKYGALSVAEGMLDISGSVDGDDVCLVWTETGGPGKATPSSAAGFGSMLTERVVKQLRGSIDRAWTGDGLVVTLRMSGRRLAD